MLAATLAVIEKLGLWEPENLYTVHEGNNCLI